MANCQVSNIAFTMNLVFFQNLFFVISSLRKGSDGERTITTSDAEKNAPEPLSITFSHALPRDSLLTCEIENTTQFVSIATR